MRRENPALWRGHLDQVLARRKKSEVKHHPALPYEEIPEFWKRKACRRCPTPIPGWQSRAKLCSIGAIDSHCAADRHVLSDHERRFLLTRRVGHLATADSRAIPHVLPVCFAISQGTLYITIDEKPKRVAGPALKRVRNIERNPMVAVVVDRYDEDWARLGWVMLRGRAEILHTGTEHDRAQELLRSRYRQLAAMQIAERPVIAVRLERVTSWGNLSVSADEADYDGQA